MIHNKVYQKGFGVIAIIIVVAVIGVIAGAGWIVFNKTKPAKTVSSAAKMSEPSETKAVEAQPSPTEANKNVVKIPELGIQLTVSDSIKDLTYQVQTGTENGRTGALAYFSTTSLTQLDKNCGAESGAVGALSKTEGQYPGDPNDPEVRAKWGQLYKQFPTFYLIASAHGEGCSTNKEALTSQNVYVNEFRNALPTIEPIE